MAGVLREWPGVRGAMWKPSRPRKLGLAEDLAPKPKHLKAGTAIFPKHIVLRR